MAITSSAKKAIRVSARKRVFNLERNRVLKSAIKEYSKLALAGQTALAAELLPKVYQAIDKVAKRGIIKPNAAARKKSRLARLLKIKSEK